MVAYALPEALMDLDVVLALQAAVLCAGGWPLLQRADEHMP